jgi:hypothetical protein
MRSAFQQLSLVCLTLVTLGSLVVLPGCADSLSSSATAQAVEQDQEFIAWYRQLNQDILADPHYNRFPLDTKAQTDEFAAWLHAAYRHTISLREFGQRVDRHYPGHYYEIGFITERLPQ